MQLQITFIRADLICAMKITNTQFATIMMGEIHLGTLHFSLHSFSLQIYNFQYLAVRKSLQKCIKLQESYRRVWQIGVLGGYK